ncbi:hypothetical protein GC163_19990 [bacterium]|nr:hypothetical protein [bacterium]
MTPLLTRYWAMLKWTLMACLIAGFYGMLHNQVSYTVSPDYFHAFKFHQFRFPESLRNRGGASLVGFLASWWTGLAIGPVLFMTYHLRLQTLPTAAQMFRGFAIVLGTTAIVGAAALALGYAMAGPQSEMFAPQAAQDPVAFVRAGIMHDGSYLGGVLGTVLAACFGLPRPRSSPPEFDDTEAPPT